MLPKVQHTGRVTKDRAHAAPPAGGFVVRLFWRQASGVVTETIKFNSSIFTSDVTAAAVSGSELTRPQLHRVVFFNTDNAAEEPLLVLDVHPSSSCKISTKKLDLDLRILTPFAPMGKRLALQPPGNAHGWFDYETCLQDALRC